MSARKAPPRRAPAKAPQPVALPVAPKTAWRLIVGSIAGLGATAAVVWAVAAGLPRQATLGLATASSEAGFVVRQVEIDGATNQPRLSIYREVLDGGSDSMLLADLDAMRERLVALPWVKDASIQRRWPDRLHIHIEERKPAALWQYKGRLRLIDAEGAVLPAPDLSRFAAQRRWDIRMKSGETISLPEGPAAEAAFLRFADLNRSTPLLGRGFVRFDLRLPDKMVVRVAGEPGQPVKPRPEPKVEPPAAVPQGNAGGVATPEARPTQTALRVTQPIQEVTI